MTLCLRFEFGDFLHMNMSDDLKAFAALVVFRASLLSPSAGFAGARLPSLKNNLREWCFSSRNHNDLLLLLLEARVLGQKYKRVDLQKNMAISRNTVNKLLREAVSFHLVDVRDQKTYVIRAEFFAQYCRAYEAEFRSMAKTTAALLATTIKKMIRSPEAMSLSEAQKKMIEFSILSRAQSVKADRKLRVSVAAQNGSMDISSWVVANKFNRDLLLLVMAARINDQPTNVTNMMASLNVSRNALKASLSLGVGGGFLCKQKRGYMASEQAVLAYLNWHQNVFATFDDSLLTAFCKFHQNLADS